MFLFEQDDLITQIVLNFFTAVQNRWPEAWNDLSRKGNVLPKTNGFKALMRFLKPLYLNLSDGKRSYVPELVEFSQALSKVKLNDAEFSTETFKPGTSGEALLHKLLLETIKAPHQENSESLLGD